MSLSFRRATLSLFDVAFKVVWLNLKPKRFDFFFAFFDFSFLSGTTGVFLIALIFVAGSSLLEGLSKFFAVFFW